MEGVGGALGSGYRGLHKGVKAVPKGRYFLTQGAVRTYGRGWRYFMKWLEEPVTEAEGFIEEGRGALFFFAKSGEFAERESGVF